MKKTRMKHKIAAATVTRAAMRLCIAWTWISNSILPYISFVLYSWFFGYWVVFTRKKTATKYRHDSEMLVRRATKPSKRCKVYEYRSHPLCCNVLYISTDRISTVAKPSITGRSVSISFLDEHRGKKTVSLSFGFILLCILSLNGFRVCSFISVNDYFFMPRMLCAVRHIMYLHGMR